MNQAEEWGGIIFMSSCVPAGIFPDFKPFLFLGIPVFLQEERNS